MADKIYNIGIIGLGGRAKGIWESVETFGKNSGRQFCRIAAVTDVRDDVKDDLVKLGYPDARVYTDAEEMYKNEQLDGVIIATRCSHHTEYAMLNARYGIPVLLEKPVCTNEADLARLCTIVDKMNDKTVVSFPLRFTPIAVKAKEIIDSGILGTISQIQAVNNVPYARGYYHGWYRDDKETGGLFLQKATHDLDVIQFLLDEPKPEFLAAMESKLVFKGDMPAGTRCGDCPKRETCPESAQNVATYGDRYGVKDGCCFAVDTGNHDSASIMVKYDSGICAVYSQNFVARKEAGRRAVRVIGYNATLEFNFTTNQLYVYYHNVNKSEHYDMTCNISSHHGGGDYMMVKNYIDVLGGGKAKNPLKAGITSAELCLAAIKSSATNTFVNIEKLF